jgi:hypothetical protein
MKNALHSWPVGQLVAVRQTPSTQPPEMQRWPAPYSDAQVASLLQSTHELETQTLPELQSADARQLPVMHAPFTQR